MRWTDCRIVAFDTETTGLNPFEGDRVIEFGAAEIRVGPDGRVAEARPHQMLVNPEMPIPRAASRVSGITDEDVARAPTFDKIAGRICELLEGAILVAHNLSFDLNFLRAELGRAGRFWPRTVAEIDTLGLSQRLLGELKSHKLEVVAQHLGVPHETAHRASDDATACGRAFVEMARRDGAPSELEPFVDWADAISAPPETGHLVPGSRGVPEFAFAPWTGRTVEEAPEILQWMTFALERRDGGWQPRFPDSVRTWARRWLRVRCSGRIRASARSQGSQDWTLDPPAWKRE